MTGLSVINGDDRQQVSGRDAAELVKIEDRDTALERAERTPAQEFVHALTLLRKPSEIATIVALVPVGQLPLFLAQDSRTFAPATTWDADPDGYDEPQGALQALTHTQYHALCAAGQQAWIVPIDRNSYGEAVRYALRDSITRFHPSEALDRLEAILDSDEDDLHKGAALRAFPHEYMLLALRYAKKQEPLAAHEKLEQMARIFEKDPEDEGFLREIEGLEMYSDGELHSRMIEDRERLLADAMRTIELTPEAAAAQERLQAKVSSKSLLDDLE